MTSIESPLNAAHQHAANAEDHIAQGLLIPAAEEHYKAAEAFLACVDASTEENTKRTLRMLYNEHSKAGKELQRKIEKLRNENKDPSLPQKLPKVTSNAAGPSSVAPPVPPASPPPTARNNLSDSQQTVDESFMLLAHRSEGGDAFNHFWKITEGMLEHLSQPVAFAIAPLGPPENSPPTSRRRETSSSSDTDIEETISRTLSRGVGLVKAAGSKMLPRNDSFQPSDVEAGRTTFVSNTSTVVPLDDWDDDIFSDDGDMAESFLVIPSSKAETSVAVLKRENATLKSQLEEMRKQLESADRALKQRKEHDQQLRDSILLARKEAQRAMTSSMLRQGQQPVDLASLTINAPPVPTAVAALNVNPQAARDRETQLLRRVRELEEELRLARVENEKQKAMITKFRERWEKLKESAKRKKQARAAAEATSVVNDRIEEEPEAEAQAERDDLQC